MGISVDMEFNDRQLKKLLKTYETLPGSTQRRVLRPAIRSGASIVNKDAKQRVPVKTKALKKSLGVRMKTYSRNGVIVGVVGPRVGFRTVGENGRVNDPAKYAHLVELGHGGPRPAPPHPFLRPALETNRRRVFSQIKRKTAQGIVKLAQKAGTK